MTSRDRFIPAAVVSVTVVLVYLLTLSPSAAMWDAGEYIAAAKTMGIPHQPGNPLFVLIAHVAGLVPVAQDYAVRINMLAALSSALTAGLWFLCAERMLRQTLPARWPRIAAATVASLLGASAFTVWNQSVVMEKVYPLSLVGLALISWLMLLWFDAEERRADRLLVLIVYLVGLTYTIHPAGLLPAGAIGIAVLMHRPRTILRWKLVLASAGALIFGLTTFAVLPVRAAHDPFINESAVSACEDGRIEAACTFSAETARRLVGTIQRDQYPANPVSVRRAPFQAQVQQFWTYFKWQWFRDFEGRLAPLQSAIAWAMLILGIIGLASLATHRAQSARAENSPRAERAGRAPMAENSLAAQQRGRAPMAENSPRAERTGRAPTAENSPAAQQRGRAPFFWYFAPLAVTFTILLIIYLNFRYSSGQSPELGNLVDREPRERDYFYMWTFSLWGMLAGLGLASVWKRRQWDALAFVLVPLAANFETASRSGQSFTREWAADILNSVEPNGVLITNGDNDSFPLWYAQSVEGVRPDVTVALVPYLGMDWYARQLNRRANIWKLSDQELDTIPGFIENRAPVQFAHGEITATITQRYLTRDQLLVLRAIKDSFPSRPIYFSFGPYAQQLGLGEYVKRVGLVQKLAPHPVREDPDTVALQEGLYVDVPRSLELWKKYGGPGQVIREASWPDRPSADVPLYYAIVGRDLALALDARGRRAEAEAVIDVARRIAAVVQDPGND